METDSKKPEHMTSLSGNRLVMKTHGRIAFRGKVDSLEAEFIEAQVLASQLGDKEHCGYLGEVLDFLRKLMSAEVKETPIKLPLLFGMDAEEIHRQIAEGNTFLLPSYTQGPLAARLNKLRAIVRETELLAVKVFGPEEAGEEDKPAREDIILALNRLSSTLWWLFLRHVN